MQSEVGGPAFCSIRFSKTGARPSRTLDLSEISRLRAPSRTSPFAPLPPSLPSPHSHQIVPTDRPPLISDDPQPIDLVVISHNHYDHLSLDSIVQINKHHPSPHFLVPLGLAAWFRETGVPPSRVQELDWWEETLFTPNSLSPANEGQAGEGSLRIACTPCQHGSGRAGWDKGSSLWASWCVGLVGSKSDRESIDEMEDLAKRDWEAMRYKVFFAGCVLLLLSPHLLTLRQHTDKSQRSGSDSDTAYRQFERKDSKYTCPAFKGASHSPPHSLRVRGLTLRPFLHARRNRPNHLSLVRPPPPAHRSGLFAALHRLHGALPVLRPCEKAGGRRDQPGRADEHGPPYTWVRPHMASSFFSTAAKLL